MRQLRRDSPKEGCHEATASHDPPRWNPHGGDHLDLPEPLVDGLRSGRLRASSYRGMARNLGCASALSTRREPFTRMVNVALPKKGTNLEFDIGRNRCGLPTEVEVYGWRIPRCLAQQWQPHHDDTPSDFCGGIQTSKGTISKTWWKYKSWNSSKRYWISSVRQAEYA